MPRIWRRWAKAVNGRLSLVAICCNGWSGFRANSNGWQQGWGIVVSNSYSANVGLAIEVATALYKAGAPLLIYGAEKLLRILLEEDYVRLVPDSFHNYMSYQDEGAVYELPWEYECSDDDGSILTKEQYQTIVFLAEW